MKNLTIITLFIICLLISLCNIHIEIKESYKTDIIKVPKFSEGITFRSSPTTSYHCDEGIQLIRDVIKDNVVHIIESNGGYCEVRIPYRYPIISIF